MFIVFFDYKIKTRDIGANREQLDNSKAYWWLQLHIDQTDTEI